MEILVTINCIEVNCTWEKANFNCGKFQSHLEKLKLCVKISSSCVIYLFLPVKMRKIMESTWEETHFS